MPMPDAATVPDT